MKKYKSDITLILGTIILGISILIGSKFVFQGNFINDRLSRDVEYYKAEVLSVNEESLQNDPYIENLEIGTQSIDVKVLEGQYEGDEFNIVNRISRLYNTKVEEGTKVIVGIYHQENQIADIAIYSYNRSWVLGVLIILFFLVVVLVGGIKGIKSIVSLVFTLICTVFLMLPLMFRGVNPILAAIIIAILSITVTLILVSGINKKTLTAVLGTIIGVVISGVIALIFGNMAHLSGITMEDAESIMYIAENSNLKVTGIMFAGILVASLGAVMDVAMSITSSVFEIHLINPNRSIKELFMSGMNIGRDIIGTMTNTLILAFAGGSITTVIMLFSSNMSTNQMLNLDVVGTEVIQGLAGSIGIVLTVPITAIMAAYLINYKKKDKM